MFSHSYAHLTTASPQTASLKSESGKTSGYVSSFLWCIEAASGYNDLHKVKETLTQAQRTTNSWYERERKLPQITLKNVVSSQRWRTDGQTVCGLHFQGKINRTVLSLYEVCCHVSLGKKKKNCSLLVLCRWRIMELWWSQRLSVQVLEGECQAAHMLTYAIDKMWAVLWEHRNGYYSGSQRGPAPWHFIWALKDM